VDATAGDGQSGLWREIEGVFDLNKTLDDASAKDVLVDDVA
jgi:hypothetical protein